MRVQPFYCSVKGMLTQLRAIFDLIVQFQSTQESMYHTALDELRARQRLDELAKERTDKVSVRTFLIYSTF